MSAPAAFWPTLTPAEKRCALLFIDLDNFRLLNNGYGHRVGDQMLSIVASRIRNAITRAASGRPPRR